MNTTLPGIQTKNFNGEIFSQDDLRPTFDIVTAMHIYGASQPAWIIDEYAFPPFMANVTSGNATKGVDRLFGKPRLS
jgi:hypothetical protein